MKMNRATSLYILLVAIVSTSLSSCGCYYTLESCIGFDYSKFRDVGVHVSPYDAPSNDYELIGECLKFSSINR